MTKSCPKVKRYAAVLEYDGSQFNGWQIQKNASSIQETLEDALSQVGDESIRVIAAGRTDTGVHATGQVVHFDSSSERTLRSWLRGCNTILPKGVAVLRVYPVSNDFHARFSATGRSYRYIILNRPIKPTYLNGRVTWEYRNLDIQEMKQGAMNLIGSHDFNAYRATSCQSKQSVRELRRLDIQSSGQWVWIDVEASGFLKHMVRNIVGVLLSIGSGERKSSWSMEVLRSKNRTHGGVTARPDGLYFSGVSYQGKHYLEMPPECCFW